MGAVGVGVGHEDDPAVARAPRGRTSRPEPAPTTWMIEAHSAFLSMSPTEAFWTLRILPRIGSSAWNSELRASLAVPSAESPSTMNSSVRSLSVAAAVGQLGRAAPRTPGRSCGAGSPCAGAARSGSWTAPATFSISQLGLGLLGPLGGGEELLQLGRHHLAYDGARGGGAEDLLGLALELRLGQPHRHHGGHPLEDVVLDDVVVVDLERLGGPHRVVERLGERRLEAADVGAALGGGDHVDEGPHLGVVAGAPAARRRRP